MCADGLLKATEMGIKAALINSIINNSALQC